MPPVTRSVVSAIDIPCSRRVTTIIPEASTVIEINSQRLLADLRQLATFGKVGTGVDRPAFSDADVSARRWLAQRMQEAKLAADIDRYGNVFGRSAQARRAVVIGSHTDSVP